MNYVQLTLEFVSIGSLASKIDWILIDHAAETSVTGVFAQSGWNLT